MMRYTKTITVICVVVLIFLQVLRTFKNQFALFDFKDNVADQDSPSAKRSMMVPELMVGKQDFIYSRQYDSWDSAPVVVEEYKLVFFTVPKVACTTWKQLFRRIRGKDDWRSQDWKAELPHKPQVNGLKYLWDYSLDEATDIMTNPDYTRAIFVRDPKERFLSSFLDKVIRLPEYVNEHCCKWSKECLDSAQSLEGFLDLIKTCPNDHWSPLDYRMEDKYWPYINFVGHFDSMEADAKQLLQLVGAWEVYGQSGWGADGELGIFSRATNTQEHVTNAKSKASKWFTTPELERLVEAYYSVDYDNPIFNFKKTRLSSNSTT
jgi:hypothetical protein